MTEIITLLQCVDQTFHKTTLKQLATIVTAMLSMTGRVTMLGISRWQDKGGSYRTIQRFYSSTICWRQLNWLFIKTHFLSGVSRLVLLGDEVVVTKSGKKTHGVDYFFSSMAGKSVRGLSFFALSLLDPEKGRSMPISFEQGTREQSTHPRSRSKKSKKSQQNKDAPKKKVGRPKGSKNKNRRDIELPSYLKEIQARIEQTLAIIGEKVAIDHCVFDGAFGNNNAIQMVRQLGLHLVSKLRRDSALYFPFTGEQKKKGAKRKYGKRVDYEKLPEKYCVSTKEEKGIETKIYNMVCLHKSIWDKLNVVVITKHNRETGKFAHVVLFSTDLALGWETLISYYRLRFQIEFNFRDAKQYFGLEDFMNVKQLPVYNAANLAMFMVNVSQKLIDELNLKTGSVTDLKARYRGHFYARRLLKLLPDFADDILIQAFFAKASSIGAIHPSEV